MDTLHPHYLRVEYRQQPEGLDTPLPRLSWLAAGEGRAKCQTAYRVLVASSREKLALDLGDLWDSGQVAGDLCAQVAYQGRPLASRMVCWWKVRLWDERDRPSAWSDTARWSMGLLDDADWAAQWIGFDESLPRAAQKQAPMSLENAPWMSLQEAPQPPEVGLHWVYRKVVVVPNLALLGAARMAIASGDQFALYLNGRQVGASYEGIGAWRYPQQFDLMPHLSEGENVLAIDTWYLMSPAPGVIGNLELVSIDGNVQAQCIDATWRASDQPADGWQAPGFDDATWAHPHAVAQEGDAPWGKLAPAPVENPPCPYLRQSFSVHKEIVRATVYASALGLFELHLNGRKVGDDCLTPGWSDFNQRVYYLTHDATGLLEQGPNAVGVILGHGWYSGYLGWESVERGHYGKHPRALMQLEIDYTDGTRDVVATNEAWRARYGPILGSDLYMGCRYDARQELPGWDTAAFDDGTWAAVKTDPTAAPPLLQTYPGIPVRRVMELAARVRTEPVPGTFVFDLGQNMVGWVRLRVTGTAGTRVRLRHGEMLNDDGTLYVRNLRSAQSTDEYWLKGEGEEVWEPLFTFHGFRYVEVTGYPGTPPLGAVTGIVVHNDLPITGSFSCSDAALNQLQSNIVWSQRGNFLEVPTDCPQRDERLGWMGDAQVFAPTACFNMDAAPFYTKWLRDVRDAQSLEGSFAVVAPRVVMCSDGAPAWADAGVIVPWVAYQTYNDPGLLAENYNAMARWVDFLDRENPDHRWVNRVSYNFGDWLAVGEETPKDLIATAYFARSAQIVAEAARVLGHDAHATRYDDLAAAVRDAFVAHYADESARLIGDTQTGYALALQFDLLPAGLRPKALAHLVRNIRDRGTRLTTGFVGCSLLLHALSRHGARDLAFELLQSDAFPSWLYPIRHGATTIWERWDGWTLDRGFQDAGMNSFNHYAFGAVGDWMYRNVAGIDADPDEPGYGRIVFRPRPGGTLTWADAKYESIRGTIACRWRLDVDQLAAEATVPVSTEAVLLLPVNDPERVRESGKQPVDADGVTFEGVEGEACRYTLQSGNYRFVCRLS
jgi:alpha-L-rhamnosidase